MDHHTLLTRLPASSGRYAEHAAALRALVPELAAETARAIEHEVPAYRWPSALVDTRRLERTAFRILDRFVEYLIDPGRPLDDLIGFSCRIGAAEAAAGRTTAPWNAAVRVAAGTLFQRFSEEPWSTEPGPAVAVPVMRAFLRFADILTAAVDEGHAEVRRVEDRLRPVEILMNLLVAQNPPEPNRLRNAMYDAGWKEPKTAAAVALIPDSPRSHRPFLPPDVLADFHGAEPFLIVPDPEGPGRERSLRAALSGWSAALGPTVAPGELADSLRWAREALDLSRRGVIHDPRAGGLIVAARHLPIILMSRDRLAASLSAHRLAPLQDLPPDKRYRLVETLLAAIECGFNAQRAAERLMVHAQTVRYRLRNLEHLFGDEIYDPALQLEFHLLLRTWLATRPSATSELR